MVLKGNALNPVCVTVYTVEITVICVNMSSLSTRGHIMKAQTYTQHKRNTTNGEHNNNTKLIDDHEVECVLSMRDECFIWGIL